MWKKYTYERFSLDNDYDLHLKHVDGYEALGTTSGGEREVLALSFTLALHQTSGFEVPVIIDRPFAMASGEPIKHIAEAFLEFSKKKQTILLLSPEDYSRVEEILRKGDIEIRALKLIKNEKEVEVEAIK